MVGEHARSLFDDAKSMLAKVVGEKWLTANAVIGLFPANSLDDDILIYADENRDKSAAVLHHLRQQNIKPPGRPNMCLADFVAPTTTQKRDYVGAFAVTTGLGIEKMISEFEQDHNDYDSIMLKAIADRLAEALAEHMHQRIRAEFWGYAPDEQLDAQQLIKEKYTGIRPAPGYPACPDHTEKATLFSLLSATKATHIELTESFAMYPAASVSGWYFSHPDSQYFNVGKIGRDQVAEYAQRKGMSLL